MSETNDKQIKFEFDREGIQAEYSNVANVFYTPSEFLLEFGYADPVVAIETLGKGGDTVSVKTKSRIIVPIESMHTFVNNINAQYRAFLEAATAARKAATNGKS